MKVLGAVILAIGIALGIYAVTMSVGLEIPKKAIGFGITTPSVLIADLDLVTKRRDYLIYAGVLAAVGGLLLVAGKMRRK